MVNHSSIEKKLLHYTGKAIADFNMIQPGDRVLVCLSGGKDSFALLTLLNILQKRTRNKFTLFVFMLNPDSSCRNEEPVKAWLQDNQIPFEIVHHDLLRIIQQKIPTGKSYCSFCSRLRRGIIYTYAKQHDFKKIALGHHRDDLIESLLMSILYSGEIRSQPPKLLTNDKKHIVIRPLSYCQEKDIINYANVQNFPIISHGNCSYHENSTRAHIKKLIRELALQNPKVPSNILHALQGVRKSQLMDSSLWDFKNLEESLL